MKIFPLYMYGDLQPKKASWLEHLYTFIYIVIEEVEGLT